MGTGGGAREAAEEQQQRLAAQVLGVGGGELLVGVAGTVLAIVGITQLVLVGRRAYATEIHIEPQSERGERITHLLAWCGYS
jgi:hypothetical protein